MPEASRLALTDLAPWPADNHPLNAADAERSKARVADIELGLSHPMDGSYWRDKLDQRVGSGSV